LNSCGFESAPAFGSLAMRSLKQETTPFAVNANHRPMSRPPSRRQ
jgi:hypothetical protein